MQNHIEDLALATACALNVPTAWHDLHELYEYTLIRHSNTRLEKPDAVLFVRQMLRSMRDEHELPVNVDPPPFALYTAEISLRRWLCELATRRLNSCSIVQELAFANAGAVSVNLRPRRVACGELTAQTGPLRFPALCVEAGC